jgi:6-pyruvoyltetrahydropterin/6-carboxytetrahydropterin synthase
MRTTIKKSYTFSAAHWIPTLPDGHRCRSVHGHTYAVEVEADGYREDTGMVVDFEKMDSVVKNILDALDHVTLNNIMQLDVPTVEVISRYIMAKLEGITAAYFVSVSVREGNGGSATTTR